MANTETETDASRIMFINSADTELNGLDRGITTDYSFTPDESIVVPRHHSILLSLHHTQIPYSFYNFQNNRNNKLDFALTAAGVTGTGTTNYTITLPEANYNAATLRLKIKELLEAHAQFDGTINIIFNRDTLKYEWNYKRASAGKSRLTLLIGTGNFNTVNFRNEMGFIDNKFIDSDPLIDVWFEDNGTTQLGGSSSVAGGTTTLFTATPNNRDAYWDGSVGADSNNFSVVDILSTIRSLYIRTNLTTGSILDSSVGGGFSSILARVPIEVGSGGIITVSPSDGAVHKLLLKIKEISKINVRLTDQKNRVIDLNGLDWDVSLQFDFIETPQVKVPKDKRLLVEKQKYDSWLEKTKTEKQDRKK